MNYGGLSFLPAAFISLGLLGLYVLDLFVVRPAQRRFISACDEHRRQVRAMLKEQKELSEQLIVLLAPRWHS